MKYSIRYHKNNGTSTYLTIDNTFSKKITEQFKINYESGESFYHKE